MKLFQSNQMIELARVFCERNSRGEDPFTPTTVIVPSIALGGWLKLQLAGQHGIAANVDCVLPATYLWRLYRQLIPATGNLDQSPFERNRLAWRIMQTLLDRPDLSAAVTRYLDAPGDRDLRLMQLSFELASLFDAYLMYRPRWMLDWQYGNTEQNCETDDSDGQWQAALWRAVLEDMHGLESLHRAALHQQFLQQVAADADLPDSHLSVFGFSTLPPLQLETFEQLSARIDVDVYFLNPSEHYWGDIVSPRDLARRSIRQMIGAGEAPLVDEDYLEVGNPLLASLGKQGRELFEQLIESPRVESFELFMENPGDRALDYIKNDILNLTHGGEFDSDMPPQPRPFNDHSLQIHSCHSPMREVEVLKDEILRAMSADPGIKPADIIVMVPDIARYAPYIHAVFTGELPYRVNDQTILDASPLMTSFLALVNLPVSRLTATEVMDLLETPAIMRRFNLLQPDLDTLAYWIDAVSIRWEVDGASKSERWDLPAEHQNSWRFGLDRLLLGFAMNEATGSWQNILPFEVTAAEAERLGILCYFIDQLQDYRSRLSVSHTPAQWLVLLADLVSDFFDPAGDEEFVISQLLKAAESVTAQAASADYTAPLSREGIAFALQQALTEDASNATIISGGITFANLVPMRSIPFRMVCLLGMNDGDYPRDKRPHSFDLIAQGNHQPGDRSRKLDDRYLFLEALLSASDIFYVSYVGQGVRDNQTKPPSVVVNEWLSYLDDCLETVPLTEHALQPFNPRYYRGDADQSFEHRWHEALTSNLAAVRFNDHPLSLDSDQGEGLSAPGLELLDRFLRHPARFFLQQRLGVYLDSEDRVFRDTEAFEPDQLERYQLAEQALVELVNGRSLEQYRANKLLSGELLAGAPGERQLDREITRAANIHAQVQQYTVEGPRDLRSEIVIGNQHLPVTIDNLYGDHLVRFRVGSLGAKDRLQAWVMHLAANLVEESLTTVIVTRGKNDAADTSWIAPVEPAEAEVQLQSLLSLYLVGCTEPLFLPPAASEQFAKDLAKLDSTGDALKQAHRKWAANQQAGAEQFDRYWQRLFPENAFDEAFAERALQLWQPINRAFEAGREQNR